RRARPPGGRFRRAAGGDADVRAAAPRRRARSGRDLLGRRAGRRDRDRGRRRVTERVLVVGAGQMGAATAQVAAAAGMRVTLVDVGEEQLERGRAGIAASLAKLAAKGQGDDPDAVLARISTSTQIAAAADAELAIEAVSEDVAVKLALFGQLDAALGEGAVLASNTSSIPV